jgi:hypothetical protein
MTVVCRELVFSALPDQKRTGVNLPETTAYAVATSVRREIILAFDSFA